MHDGAVPEYADNGRLDVDEAGSRGVHDDVAGQADMLVVDGDDGLDAAVGEAGGGVPVIEGKEGVDGGGPGKGQVSSWPHDGSSHGSHV